jgi:cell division protein FtsZ
VASTNPRNEAPVKSADPSFDYLDIPAFLRRQAD